MYKIIIKITIFVVFLPLFGICGCGKGHVPMSGHVTFSDDGSPLTKGKVCFETDKEYAYGKLDENGRYVLGFGKSGNGLPKGEYGVCVIGAQVEDMGVQARTSSKPSKEVRFKSLIDLKYASSVKSGLTCTVDGQKKTFDFTVDRAK